MAKASLFMQMAMYMRAIGLMTKPKAKESTFMVTEQFMKAIGLTINSMDMVWSIGQTELTMKASL
jgi:hypothetical protein